MATPISIVEQHLKTLTDQAMSVKSKLEYAKEVATILNKGDDKKQAITDEDRKNMYVWFKIGMEIPLAKEPGLFDIIPGILWKLHKSALENKVLTPERCQKNYLEFIINILRNNNLRELVNKIFDEDQKKKLGAVTGAAQPKKSMFSFGKPKLKPAAANSAAVKAAADVAKPVVFTAAGNAATTIHSAHVDPTPTMLVAANKSISDPTNSNSGKKLDATTLT